MLFNLNLVRFLLFFVLAFFSLTDFCTADFCWHSLVKDFNGGTAENLSLMNLHENF